MVIRTAFANISCSQCGQGFGPGVQGFSSCLQHRLSLAQATQPAPENKSLTYVNFRSAELGGDVRVGLDVEDPSDVLMYQFGPVGAGATIYEVRCGGIQWEQHLAQSALNVLEAEACAALAAAVAARRQHMEGPA